MTPARLTCVMFLACALALAVVQQSAVTRRAGYRVEALKEELVEQRSERSVYLAHVSKLRNPARVRRLVSWLKLDVVEPVPPAAPADVVAGLQDQSSPLVVAKAVSISD